MTDDEIPVPRVVGADEIRAAVGWEELVEPLARAFQESSAGRAQNGFTALFPASRPELGDVYVKSGVLRGHGVYIVKVSPWFAVNAERGLPQGGLVAVFDSATGHTLAILDDQHHLSDLRTAATGALVARAVAPARVDTAMIIGAGRQAYLQALALFAERPMRQLTVWARDQGKAAALAQRLSTRLTGVDVATTASIEAGVRSADVLVTTTGAREPIVRGAWLHPGQHITAVGADDPTKAELDADALRRARVFVDSREANEANGDVHRAAATQGYEPGLVVGEIGDVLSGQVAARTSQDDITIVKLVGIGAQDLVAAEVAVARLTART